MHKNWQFFFVIATFFICSIATAYSIIAQVRQISQQMSPRLKIEVARNDSLQIQSLKASVQMNTEAINKINLQTELILQRFAKRKEQ